MADKPKYAMTYGDEVDKIKTTKSKMVWREQSGLLTPIPQMSDHHLMCSIRMVQESIREKKFWRSAYLPYLYEERAYRRALIKKKGDLKCQPR